MTCIPNNAIWPSDLKVKDYYGKDMGDLVVATPREKEYANAVHPEGTDLLKTKERLRKVYHENKQRLDDLWFLVPFRVFVSYHIDVIFSYFLSAKTTRIYVECLRPS